MSWAEFIDGKCGNVSLIKCWHAEDSISFATIKLSSRKAFTHIFSTLLRSVTHVSVFPLGVVIICVEGPFSLIHAFGWESRRELPFSTPASRPEKCVVLPPEGSHALCCVHNRRASWAKTFMEVQQKPFSFVISQLKLVTKRNLTQK